jgi:hypothetical protein
MAGDPIVIDDGGSTRIKKLRNREVGSSVGAMNDLLTVIASVGPPAGNKAGSHDTAEARDSSYGERIEVTYIDSDGKAHSAAGFPLAFRDFTVDCGQHFHVDGDLIRNPGSGFDDLRITVSGDGPGGPPIVDAKQHDRQRRYIVTNTASITKVTVRPAGGGQPVDFDASVPIPDPNNPGNMLSVLYTCVYVR